MDLENTWSVIADAGMKSAVLCAAGLLVAGGLMRGTSAARRHIVYAGVLIACLLLPAMSLLLPQWRILPQWPGSARQSPTSITSAIEVPPAMPSVTTELAIPLAAMTPELAIGAMPTPAPIHPALYSQFTLTHWLTLVWLSGTALFLLPLLFGQFAIIRIRRAASHMGTANCFSSPRCRMPMACGLLRPAIILPADAQAWPADRRDAAIRHESEHLRRHDCLWQQVGQIARALYWFNPLIWLVHQRMLCEAELACDDAVLIKGSSKPSDYAEHLLAVATTGRSQPFVTSAAVAMARSNSLEGRLRSILDGARSRQAVTRKLVCLCIALLLCVAAPLAMLRAQVTATATPPASGITTPRRIGLYVITKPANIQQAAETALADLELAAAPLFSEGDIRAYEWPTHTIHLRPGVTDSIRRLGERPFVLVVDGQRIYQGALRSVNDFTGPTIYVGLSDTNWPPESAFVIERSTAEGSPDVRNSEILKQALLDLGLLQERRAPVPDPRPATTRSAAPTGRLEFRVAVTLNAADGVRVTPQQMPTLLRELLWQGPEELSKKSPDLIWVETDVVEPSVVSGEYQKKQYLLLSNSPEHTMLYDGTWGMTQIYEAATDMAGPAIGFTFDDAGAAKFKELTSNHVKQVLACVLDGKVVSIATILTVMSRSGIISAEEMNAEERARVVMAMKAAMVKPTPSKAPVASPATTRALDMDSPAPKRQSPAWGPRSLLTAPPRPTSTITRRVIVHPPMELPRQSFSNELYLRSAR